jgi:PAS domain S-box-containing protein
MAIIDGEIAPRLEQRHVKLDGTHFEVEVQTRSIMMDGEVTALTIVHDITKRKQVAKTSQKIVKLFDHSLNKYFMKTEF